MSVCKYTTAPVGFIPFSTASPLVATLKTKSVVLVFASKHLTAIIDINFSSSASPVPLSDSSGDWNCKPL